MKLGFCLLFAIAVSAAHAADLPELQVVPQLDLNRYLGKWYEIAKFPTRFQKGCDCAIAEYSLRKDGDIEVTNRCVQMRDSKKLKTSTGRAWVPDPATPAKLRVRFFWPFSGNYWVIDLGKDYEYSVVSEPDRDYLWILSRSPQLAPEVYEAILSRLRKKGFDLKRLEKSKQTPDPACVLESP